MINGLHIRGDAKLKRFFRTLPGRVTKNIMTRASRKGARHVVNEARKNTPVYPGEKSKGRPGDLKRSLGTINMKVRSRNTGGILVGPRLRGANGKGQHAALRSEGVAGTGQTEPLGDWIAEAAGNVDNKVFDTIKSEIAPIIDSEVRKAAQRHTARR